MILDDKKRVIGKIVSINSDRFTVELLSGLKNFSMNGYDDIHYFAQINSYVIVPYQGNYIVSEVVGVRERDSSESFNTTEQDLNKAYSVKYLEVLPVGTISAGKFAFGVSVYPTLYSDVLYIKDTELDSLFAVSDSVLPVCRICDNKDVICTVHSDLMAGKTKLRAIDVGESAVFQDYRIKVNIDKFFGGHSAVLGNTGSGKSCTISSMLQTIFNKENELFAFGATFFIFDVNGEYKQALEPLAKNGLNLSLHSVGFKKGFKEFCLPHHYLNIDEWELLFQASEKTQGPILRSALALAALFSRKGDPAIDKAKNHILASCITLVLRDESSSPSKRDRLISILRRFNTAEIQLSKSFTYKNDAGVEAIEILYDSGKSRLPCTIENCLFVHFGGMIGTKVLHDYLEARDTSGSQKFFDSSFKMPNFNNDDIFDFGELEDALELAILYEEANGNKHIRDYCSSMITRFKSIRDRSDFDFIKQRSPISKEVYVHDLLGVGSTNLKSAQIIILNIDSLDDELVEFVSAVVSRIIFETLKKISSRNNFPVNMILEEAHRYISFDARKSSLKAFQIFERIAKEGRKYGLFLLVSSQRPSELSKTVLSQCSNFIVHRIQNPEDLSHIRQITPHISEAILKKLPSVPTQHALIFGSSVSIPTLYKVKTADPLPLSDNNNISDNWFVDANTVFDLT